MRLLKGKSVQSSVEGAYEDVYLEEERRTLALSYLISNLFEAESLDECLDVTIKGCLCWISFRVRLVFWKMIISL